MIKKISGDWMLIAIFVYAAVMAIVGYIVSYMLTDMIVAQLAQTCINSISDSFKHELMNLFVFIIELLVVFIGLFIFGNVPSREVM